MSHECRCGDGCSKCQVCDMPRCECYCEDYFDDDSFDSGPKPNRSSDPDDNYDPDFD